MVMFILDKMVPQVELEGVSAACTHFSTLPVTVQKPTSSVDTFDSGLRALEDTSGLEVGGGVTISRNARRNQSRSNGDNGWKNNNGVVDIPQNIPGEAGGINCKLRYDLAQHNPPPLTHKFRVGFGDKIMDGNNKASLDTLCP